MIDKIYDDPAAVVDAVDALTWYNARVKNIFIGYEDHGLLTMTLIFAGESWVQGFHNRDLGKGDAFKNYVQGWLKLSTIESSKGRLVSVGRIDTFNSDLVAVRPIIGTSPVFWPGGDPSRFYVFDSIGNVMEPGL